MLFVIQILYIPGTPRGQQICTCTARSTVQMCTTTAHELHTMYYRAQHSYSRFAYTSVLVNQHSPPNLPLVQYGVFIRAGRCLYDISCGEELYVLIVLDADQVQLNILQHHTNHNQVQSQYTCELQCMQYRAQFNYKCIALNADLQLCDCTLKVLFMQFRGSMQLVTSFHSCRIDKLQSSATVLLHKSQFRLSISLS